MIKSLKKIISIVMIMCILCSGIVVTAYASDDTHSIENVEVTRSHNNLHKINGVYSSGGQAEYTTTTTMKCYEIRVKGHTYTSGTPKVVHVVVYKNTFWGEVPIAEGAYIYLDDVEHTLTMQIPYDQGFDADTYTVRVYVYESSKDYDISTFIYY